MSGRAVCPFRRGVASSEAETIRSTRVGLPPSSEEETIHSPMIGSLPSSEAEMWGVVEALDGEPSSEAKIVPRVREGLDGPHCVRGPRIGLL